MHQYATLEDTVYLGFATNLLSGAAGDGATPLFDVRLGGAAASAAPVLSGTPTLLTHANYTDGCYEVAIAATAGNGFAAGNTYLVFVSLTIDSVTPAAMIGSFRLAPVPANVTQWLGTAAATPTVAGVPEVDLTHVAGATTNVAALATNVDAILTDTVEIGTAGAGLTNINLPNQTMDIIGNITGNLSGSVGSVAGLTTATVHSDLDDIQARLPAALTGAGNIKADTLALDGSTTAATNLKQSATVIYVGTVAASPSPTTTTFADSGLSQADTDHWKGRKVIFLTGTLKYQGTDITVFTPATDLLTVTAFTQAPTAGDTYVVL